VAKDDVGSASKQAEKCLFDGATNGLSRAEGVKAFSNRIELNDLRPLICHGACDAFKGERRCGISELHSHSLPPAFCQIRLAFTQVGREPPPD
jgi:hypothetical protein